MRHLCGTPVVLGMAALEEGLRTFADVNMREVEQKAQKLGDLFLQLVEERCSGEFVICCPAPGERRGSQVALRHPDGYAIMQALIEAGVVGDFRAPDVIRFGLAPLYTRYVDIWDAVERLATVMQQQTWRAERFRVRAAVT
jgi:kynureninase